MKFQPCPENNFRQFIDAYFGRCRAVCPKLRVIAGKWTFEDLIPGMSDFDTRFIFTDDVSVHEWMAMSIAVGNVHTELALETPRWARMLEHLPGLNLTLSEITSPARYYPEFQQWTFYDGDPGFRIAIAGYLDSKPWSERDELFHLKKIAVYFGPYQRGIDPAVNLAKYENKYPLHSRFMHYFTPPVQSAVSLLKRRPVRGKLESLRQARDIFGRPALIDTILDCVANHYEMESLYSDKALTGIEKDMDEYLRMVYAELAGHVKLLKLDSADTPSDLRRKIAAVPVDPVESFYEGAKFSRFMKGRLLFYGTEIEWFDSTWLISNELGRIITNFYEKPLKIFGTLKYSEQLEADAVLNRLNGDILSPEICEGVRKFKETAGRPIEPGREKEMARETAAVFEPVQVMLETLGRELHVNIFP